MSNSFNDENLVQGIEPNKLEWRPAWSNDSKNTGKRDFYKRTSDDCLYLKRDFVDGVLEHFCSKLNKKLTLNEIKDLGCSSHYFVSCSSKF